MSINTFLSYCQIKHFEKRGRYILTSYIYMYCTICILDDEVSAPQIYPIRADGSTGEGFILREGLFTPEGLLNDNNGRMPLAEVRFPKLTSKQRKFAVNPGYMSYYNDDFAEIEDERDILGIYQF